MIPHSIIAKNIPHNVPLIASILPPFLLILPYWTPDVNNGLTVSKGCFPGMIVAIMQDLDHIYGFPKYETLLEV
jgi:hypothetical protein